MKTILPSSKASFPFQKPRDTFTHQQIHTKLGDGFDDQQAKIMSEAFIDLSEHLDGKLAQQTKDILEVVNNGFSNIEKRFEVNDRRFELLDRQFEDIRAQMDGHRKQTALQFETVNKQFDAITKQFEIVNQRLEDMKTHVSVRLEDHTKQIGFQITSEIHNAINIQTWRLITATIASWGVFGGLIYAFLQKG